ncbi:late competence development ComFB family protein [Synechocystis sp. LKSZ1]|uniref:late competence development ComFB family protein n=1 Tax=Synechocystis sp. LKSZ1 TaxID=3144951 RepID=UPI00336BB4AB
MNSVKDHLRQAVINLKAHPEALRIKKLLYGLYYKVWANDPATLNQESFTALTHGVIKTYPTINRLIRALHGIVTGLNRQEVYAPIAKAMLEILAPVYQVDPDVVEQSTIQALIEEKEKSKQQTSQVSINLMEVIVKDEIFEELQKLPTNVAKFVSVAEVAAYALNRLPPLYVSSEEGKYYQQRKVEEMRDSIHRAVLQGIGAVMRDPIRKATPLNLCNIDTFSSAHTILTELEEFVRETGNVKGRLTYGDLADTIHRVLGAYRTSLKEIEDFLKLHGLGEEKLSVYNLATNVRKAFRRLLKEPSTPGRPSTEKALQKSFEAQETQIMEFMRDNPPDDEEQTFATSIRDWYHF